MDNNQNTKQNINIDLNNIALTIRNKQGIVFKDSVKALTSYNEKGIFDILPEHENFISLVKEKIVVHKTIGQNQEFKIDSGLLKVFKNQVDIYLGA